MADDIIPLRASYVLSLVERISELEAEVERLRAAGDRLAEFAGDNPWAHLDIAAWQEARRG